MKRIIVLMIVLISIIPIIVNAGRGCCSHHGGQWYCDENTRRWVCNDGTYSPSCRCSIYTLDENFNNNNNLNDNTHDTEKNNNNNNNNDDVIANILAICFFIAPFGFMLYANSKSNK